MTSINDQFEVRDDSKTRVSRSGRVCKKSSKLIYFDATNGNIKKIKSSKISQQSSSSKKKKSNNIENVDVHNQTQSAKINLVTNKSQKKNIKNITKDSKNVSNIETMETDSMDVRPVDNSSVSPKFEKPHVQQTEESPQFNSSTNSDSETYSALSNNEIETPDYTSYDEESVNSDEDLLLSKNISSKLEHKQLQPTSMLLNDPPPDVAMPMIYTGYKLWSSEMKKEILKKYPTIDVNVLNIRLGEMWTRLSTMERNNWHSRARALAQKNGLQNECVMDYKIQKAWLNSCNKNTVPYGQSLINDAKLRNIELEPIDVAAYLRLLGESLMLIGDRLQQRKRPVVTSDCITVLLDSLLCAMSSLICLTQQIPLLKTVKTDVLKKTLENIAYIMPGL